MGDGTHQTEETPSQANSESRFYRQEKQAKDLIVFVHGVFGSFATTWGQGETYWPKLIEGDERFNGHDIYLVNYLTSRIATSANIHEVAGNELQRLRDRRVFELYDEIHFIAHSMGGLVTKSMLVRLGRESEGLLGLRRVRTVVFLATPAQGAPIAELGSWLSLNPQLANMTPAHANAFLQALEDEWVGLLIGVLPISTAHRGDVRCGGRRHGRAPTEGGWTTGFQHGVQADDRSAGGDGREDRG